MHLSRIWISVVPTACVAAILMSAIMGCQQNEAKKAAVDSKQLEPQTVPKTETGAAADANAPASDPEAGYWTCTMHPEIHQSQPGNCPKCGMTLVFKKTDKNPEK